jgi:hypothetical protein
MAYQVCYVKTSPCCVLIPSSSTTLTASPAQCMRSIEVYGCTPDLTQGEFTDTCCQGTFMPIGSCCAWTVPTGVCSITVELWGAGGGGSAGASQDCSGMGGGGGGGTYIKKTIPVLPNDLITFCAGAGGLMGKAGGSVDTCYCCCGQQGNCSYVRRNGIMCMDSWGGSYGWAVCASTSGCTSLACGNNWKTGSTASADDGYSYACTGYARDMGVSPSHAFVPGCQVNAGSFNVSASAGFGGDVTIWGYQCGCGSYLKWNTSCKNSAGVFGPGGDSCSTSTAFNVGQNYQCNTNNSFIYCERGKQAPPGRFPGGGGGGGIATACCNLKGAGGSGASGYIRVYY